MADQNVFDDPKFGAEPNVFDDPKFNGSSSAARRVIGDSAVTLGKGVIGAGEAVVGLADLATGGYAGKVLNDATGYDPKAAKAQLDEFLTPEQRAANAAVSSADGFLPTIEAAIRNPSSIAHAAIESAPSMIGGGAVARGIGAVAKGVAPVIRGAIGEGVVTAGAQAEQIRQETPDQLLTPEQAALAAGSGLATGALTLGAGRVAQKLGISDVDIALAGGGLQGAGKSLPRRVAEGFLSEGILEEMPQSAQEQIAQNLALDKPAMEGVGSAAAMGALTGGVIGAGVNVPRGPLARAADAGGVGPQDQKLLPSPKDMVIRAGEGSAPTEAEKARSAEIDSTARAQDAARQAEAERLQSFHGPLSTIAAGAVSSGASQAKAQEREAAIQESLNPATPLALPAPVAEQEKLAQQKVDEYLANKESTNLTEAQRKSFEGEARGHNLIVVPHPSGKGYTTIPASKLTDRQKKAVENIQRPAETAALPSPRDEMPGQWIAPEGRAPEPRTYGENNAGMRAAYDEWRTTTGTPVPRQPPIKDEKRATQMAERKTQETGREHVVVPHPMSSTGFAIAPVPMTFEGTAKRVQDQPASTDRGQTQGVDNARSEAPATEAPAVGPTTQLASNPADAARPAEAAGDAGGRQEEVATNPQDAGSIYTPAPEGGSQAYQEISRLAADAATSPENDRAHPTAAQTAAGNYKKVRIPPSLVHGLPITLENPAGSVRVAEDGSWASHTPNHYGYIRGTEGNDGDKVDVTIGPKPERTVAYVVDQINPKTGKFDEHKVMLGFDTQEQAEAAYRAAYPADWQGMGGITPVSVNGLKAWLKDGKRNAPYATAEKGDRALGGSRYQYTIDDDAGTQPMADTDRDPLTSRLTKDPVEEARIRGVGPLDETERDIVSAAILDLVGRLGVPRAMFDGLRPIGMHGGTNTGEGTYRWSSETISLHERMLKGVDAGDHTATRTLRGVIIHELLHHVDNGPDVFSSSVAPSFRIAGEGADRVPVGGIIKEAYDVFTTDRDPAIRQFLAYPFAQWIDAPPQGMREEDFQGILKNETFAQLGRLYYTNRKMLQRKMPLAHALFEEIHHAIENGEAARLAVQRTLRTWGADGVAPVGVAGRDRQADRRGAQDRQAGRGLGQDGRVLDRSAQAGAGAEQRGRDQRLEAASAPREAHRLTGAPTGKDGYEPSAQAQQAARDYAREAGIPYNPPTDYVKVDPARAERIAEAYAAMKHDPRNIRVHRAYQQMIKETVAQFRAIEKTGLDITFASKDQPYPYATPREVFDDVAQNNHMWVFPTNDGFGSNADFDPANNPLLEDTGIVIKGHKLLANDVFRIVHDYFGHIAPGVGFRANGEENAWRHHAAMYSPLARAAMTSETRGQNSWLNWGPHGEANRTAKTEDTIFADQKTGLLPDWAIEDNYAEHSGLAKPGELNVKSANVRRVDAMQAQLPEGFRVYKYTGEYGKNWAVLRPDLSAPGGRAIIATGRSREDAIATAIAKIPTLRATGSGQIAGRQQIRSGVPTNNALADMGLDRARKPDELEAREPAAPAAVVNIGLDTNDGKGITKAQALRALKKAGVKVVADEVRQSKTEQTLVASLDRPLTEAEANQVSVDLDQEAIAQMAGDQGEIYGPMAANWRPFNKRFFLSHTKVGENAIALKLADETLVSAAGTALTAQERELLKNGAPRIAMKRARRFAAIFDELPSPKEYVHAALAGKAARGWYEKSRRAGEAMYGRDYPRFAALMAALSPQTDVPTNFYNAAQVWADWHRKGRPTSNREIIAILNANMITPDGKKAGAEVMDAYKFNAIRALRHATGDVQLSGPKVESFRQNLIGNLDEVTNDRHNAAFSGIMQELLGGDAVTPPETDLSKSFLVKSPGYIATSVRYRQAARELTKATGEKWSPAEVQETSWSFWRTLYNMATAEGETRSALQLIRDGALTHELIAETPTLGQYFDTERFRRITRGEAQAADGDANAAGRISAAERGVARETGPVAETPSVVRVARRLDRLIAARRAAAEATAAEKKFEETNKALDLIGNETVAERDAVYADALAAEADVVPGFDAPRKPGILETQEPQPLWYSALSSSLDKAPFAKDGTIPSGQLRMWLASKSKEGLFKADELKWSGVDEYLAAKSGRVSKDDVRTFLDQNGVKVEEVTLGGNGLLTSLDEGAIEAILFHNNMNREDWDSSTNAERFELARAYNEEVGAELPMATKFESYQLPGGSNYKELLLTLPTKPEDAGNYDLPADHTVYRPDPDNYPYKWRHEDGRGNTIGPDFGVLPNTVAAAVRFAADRMHGGGRPNSQGGAFRSSHFDQPNILAHIRFNERTDANGNKVLFIEEIQSDWAQKGRKEGFNVPAPKPEIRHVPEHDMPWHVYMSDRLMDIAPTRAAAESLAKARGNEIAHGSHGNVPAAPFVGKTEAWVALAMKRMIRYAADHNFDAIAWTNGEQQADRYDLSKQVSEIRWSRIDGKYDLKAKPRDGGSMTSIASGVSEQSLPDYIGKDAAQKIVDQNGKKWAGSLSGLDLKVGGEGMRAFYDKIVPNVANDLLKKMGGGRAGELQIPTAERDDAVVTAARDDRRIIVKREPNGMWTARLADDHVRKGEGRFWTGSSWSTDDGESRLFSSKELAEASVYARPQPGFMLTPAMRPIARKPQVLFAQEGRQDVPSKPDILEVRTPTAEDATNLVRDLLTTSKSFNLWDRTVGTQLHKALKNPMFKRVYDGVQRYLNDASMLMMRAADLAPDMLPKLDGIRDIFRRGPSKKDLEQVSSAIFDGTLNDRVWTDAELRARGLDDKQIGLYQQSRKAIDQSLADVFTSEAVKEAKGLLPQAVLDQARETGDYWSIVNALSSLPQRSGVQQQVYDQLRLRAAEISDLQANGYAPLQRFGQYTVHVTNQAGESVLFTMHEYESEANAFAREARAQLRPGETLQQGVMSQEAWKLFKGVSPDTLEVFAASMGASQDEAMQKYLKLAVNNRSVLKRMIQRKGIAGFQTDVQRTLAQFITSNARAASKNYNWGEILQAQMHIPKEAGDVRDEASRLAEYVQNPNEEAGQIRGLLFIQFLGGSLASAITNATQPVMMTFPWLASKVGAARAAAEIAKAGKIAAGSETMEPALRAAMDRATKEGIVAPHEVHGLYAESIRNLGSNMGVRRTLKVWGSLFSIAEAFNRRITFVAAFRSATAAGNPDAYQFASDAIAETQGVYNKGNRPNWARGAVGATLFTFRQYSVAYVELLARLPKREKALMLAVLVLMSGLQGLPGADDLEDVIDTIAESLGYSFNSKKQLREWAARTLGDTAGALLTHGVSALPGVPLDVQGRLGLGNLIPGSAILKRSEQDKGRDVLEFFGPAGSQLKATMDAFSAAQEGDAGAVIKSIAPLAVQNALRGLDMAQSGFYKDSKGRRVIDVDGYDAAIKSIGFQPQKVAQQTRLAQDLQQDIGLHKDVEAKVVERMARAAVNKDQEEMMAARMDLFRWNERNPGSLISITPQQVRQRALQMLMTRDQRFIKTAPPELRAQVMGSLRP